MKNFFMVLIVASAAMVAFVGQAKASANEGAPVICPTGYTATYAPFQHRYVCLLGVPNEGGLQGGGN